MILAWLGFAVFPQSIRPPSYTLFLLGNAAPAMLSIVVYYFSMNGFEYAPRAEKSRRLILIILSVLCMAAIICFRLEDWFNPRIPGPLRWILI